MGNKRTRLRKFAESLIAPAWEFTLQRWGAGSAKAAELTEVDVVMANTDKGWIDVKMSIEVAAMAAGLDVSSL